MITIKGDNLEVSDGYHTFGELYDHRIRLFITLAKKIKSLHVVWYSDLHADGSSYDDWFIMGINTDKGKQISYHLPAKYWSEVGEFANYVDKAPEWDGHTSADVLDRLKQL